MMEKLLFMLFKDLFISLLYSIWFLRYKQSKVFSGFMDTLYNLLTNVVFYGLAI